MATRYTSWRLLALAAFLLATFVLMVWFVRANIRKFGPAGSERRPPETTQPAEERQGRL
jgi:hypothetical protein